MLAACPTTLPLARLALSFPVGLGVGPFLTVVEQTLVKLGAASAAELFKLHFVVLLDVALFRNLKQTWHFADRG